MSRSDDPNKIERIPARRPEATPDSTPSRNLPPTAAESEPASQRDRFGADHLREQFERATQRRMDVGGGHHAIRLPGTSRVVADRRQASESAEARHAQREPEADSTRRREKEPLTIREGRLAEIDEKPYANYLAGPRSIPFTASHPTRQGSPLERLLSLFEKVLIGRFEQGAKIEQGLKEGECSFLQKTAAEWKEFFTQFISRTVARSINLADIKSLILRGLVKQANQEKGVLISDLVTPEMVEKFVRIETSLNQAAALAKLLPGATLQSAILGELTSSATLTYLAIAPAAAADSARAMEEAKGQFSSKRVEDRAAEELGLNRESRTAPSPGDSAGDQVPRKLKKWGGIFGKFQGREEEFATDAAGVFIPGILAKRLPPKWRRRWFVPTFVTVIFILMAVGLWALIRYFD